MNVLCIGLGNPGERYRRTRHNVGFETVDAVAEMLRIRVKARFLTRYAFGSAQAGSSRIALVKPLTFMNRSGEVVPAVLRRSGLSMDEILVVCDTLDLPPGECRLKTKGSSAGHRGLTSIIDCVGTDEFKRIYIGIGRPPRRGAVIDYVLAAPSGQDGDQVARAVARAAEAVVALLDRDVGQVMNDLNSRKNPAGESGS